MGFVLNKKLSYMLRQRFPIDCPIGPNTPIKVERVREQIKRAMIGLVVSLEFFIIK